MTRPEEVGKDVFRVSTIPFPNAVNVLLVRESDGFTLVDTGISSSPKRIVAALESLGGGPSDLKRIFISHYHDDHTGGLEEMQRLSGAEVWASDREAEIFTGERPPDLSPNPFFRRVIRNFWPRFEVARRLREGETVAGFRVIPTPGHSLGHVSLLRDEDGLLFTADAFGALLPGRIRVGVIKPFCSDPALAKKSASDLLSEPFETAVLVHGAPLLSDAKEKLRKVVSECSY